ncbi:hypothetical protein [Flectobacillus roseus]|uniref:hypothetical protein n=1 Tax=Flectobacillus roseus TaxID=502259 RepID=UPI0024B69963|nr:hypothetical protein [Flectobacillus roseus]MDI9867725.1 hypothetical protein [Flectobacillus roseus]
MNSKLYTIVLGVALTACSTGKKALEKGNFDEAVYTAVERLQKSPTNSTSQQVLKEAYPLALNYHQGRVNNWEKSTEPFHWERVISEYDAMNQLGSAIDNCPPCIRVVGDGKKFVEPLQAARNLAASDRYDSGNFHLGNAKGNRQEAKMAFLDFERASQIIPGYKDVSNKMDNAYSYAAVNVVVEQVTVTSKLYQLSNEYFQDKVNEFLRTNPKMNIFVQFYGPQQASDIKLKPHQIVRLQFDEFMVGQTYVNTNTENITSKDSVKVGEATVNGKKVPVYNKVTAKYTKSRKTVTSNGILDMQIIDFQTKQVIHRDKIPGTFVWVNEWANFNGDERALTKDQLNLCKNKELLPPAPQILFTEFTKPIYDQLTRKIRKYYENY